MPLRAPGGWRLTQTVWMSPTGMHQCRGQLAVSLHSALFVSGPLALPVLFPGQYKLHTYVLHICTLLETVHVLVKKLLAACRGQVKRSPGCTSTLRTTRPGLRRNHMLHRGRLRGDLGTTGLLGQPADQTLRRPVLCKSRSNQGFAYYSVLHVRTE